MYYVSISIMLVISYYLVSIIIIRLNSIINSNVSIFTIIRTTEQIKIILVQI